MVADNFHRDVHPLIRQYVIPRACAPLALVLADARAPALLAPAPSALVLADARAPALLAFAPLALVLADARPPALLESSIDMYNNDVGKESALNS